MKYLVEDNLSNFQFWSGGRDRAEMFTSDQLDQIGELLEDAFGHIPTMISSGLMSSSLPDLSALNLMRTRM